MSTNYDAPGQAQRYASRVWAEEKLLQPVVLDIVRGTGNLDGKVVLDLGCGPGWYSQNFAEQGARVLAADPSEEILGVARRMHSHPNIEYFLQRGEDLSDFQEGGFNLVLMNMVVPEMQSVEALEVTVMEVSRVLKQDGDFILSALHPLYIHPGQDNSDHAPEFRIRQYAEEGSNYKSSAQVGSGARIGFNETHFTMDAVSIALERAGFFVKATRNSLTKPKCNVHLPKYLARHAVKFPSA
ncbi:class I SAM-dependent methyltransferase [Nanoarchaeota archaeon]